MNKYNFIEPINSLDNASCVNIGNGTFSLLNVLRTITGTASIKHSVTLKTYKLNQNLTYIPITEVKNVSLNKFIQNFTDVNSSTLTEPLFINRFTRAKGKNRQFYSIVEKELVEAILAYKSKNYTKSFLFIYRLIETISFTTPLIVLSKNSDYFKTYDDLKDLFNSTESIGELGFFKRFLSTLFKGEDYLLVGATLDFSCIDDIIDRSSCISIYKNYMTKKKGDNTQILGLKNETPDEITLEIINFHEFFIIFRNRFFHNLKGSIRDNIQAKEIFDTDQFFEPIVTLGLNHIGLILFKLIEKDLDF
ncbi:hypothetical protein [Acinetobacter bereziniae]|uniref:hypothetical protein n=1 Tax=Acinetobacter bereziniae TaxID=106648 RepID=UPI00124F8CB7|nr:hypothetical protein [Acinetobacter bereziniae]